MEGWTIRPRSAGPVARSGLAARDVRGRRAGARRCDAGEVQRARAVPGDRGQNLEPSGDGWRRLAGSQRPGDGGVPAGPRGPLTQPFSDTTTTSFSRPKMASRLEARGLYSGPDRAM